MMDDIFYKPQICPDCNIEMDEASVECYQVDGHWFMAREWECPDCGQIVRTETEDD